MLMMRCFQMLLHRRLKHIIIDTVITPLFCILLFLTLSFYLFGRKCMYVFDIWLVEFGGVRRGMFGGSFGEILVGVLNCA